MTQHPILFSKMHGLGNDFVVIDAINQRINGKRLPIKKIADRHFGIGCDQVLLIESSAHADFLCRIFNSDGSEAEQCGNGLRCVARYVHELGLHASNTLTIETAAGLFPAEIRDYDNICITFPPADLSASTHKFTLPPLAQEVTGSALSLGNPHFIIKLSDNPTITLNQAGFLVSTHSTFPEGANVGFVETVHKDHIRLRTFERGSGETNACGSNACAAVAAGIIDGSLSSSVTVECKYGELVIQWEGAGKPLYMTGPATLVFTGELSHLLK